MFTVIIPTHNRPELLHRTLQSLIAQTYTHFTVIVVDDAASYIPPYEDLLALQGRYIYIIRSGVAGPAESRNMGLTLAQSKYILFLDDDDTLEPGHFQSLADQLENAPVEILFCDFKVCNEERTTSPPTELSTHDISIKDVTRDSTFVINRIPNSCLVYRSDIVKNIKFKNDLLIYEDWDFLLSCLRDNELSYLNINSVVIHKSIANAPENMRRGNTRDDLIIEAMLHLYKKYPAENSQITLARQNLLATAGVSYS